MNSSSFLYFHILILVLVFGDCNASAVGLSQKADSKQNASNDRVEFILKKEEEAEIAKWDKKSFADLCDDATKCDRGALYLLGFCNMYGQGHMTIDMEKAYQFFSLSASLGYAPAIEKLCSLNANEKDNFFLALVYENLMASTGHIEFAPRYHNSRNHLSKTLGVVVVQEIERIAARKKEAIRNNIELFNKVPDKKKLYVNLKSITDEDALYNSDYWIKIYEQKSDQ